MSGPFAFVGVPIDSVGRTGGTEHGPAALRELGLVDALRAADAGDLDVRIRGEERDPETGILGSPDVLATTTTIREAVNDLVGRGERPFLVGGCCTELPGALAGARDVLGPVGLAYLDGHLDLYDGLTSPTGEAADMPVATALGLGPPAWVEACGGATVTSGDVVLLGARDPDEVATWRDLEMRGAVGPDLSVRRVDALRATGPAASGTEAARHLAALAGRSGFWLHVDVDVLDEAVFPATDYLLPGGLDLDELVEVMRPLATSPGLIGASIGCYNPEKDQERTSGRQLVSVLERSFVG